MHLFFLYKRETFLLCSLSTGTTSTGLLQAISDPLQAMQQLSVQSQANQLQQQAIIQQIQQSLRASSPTAPATTGHHFLGSRQMPKIPSSILSNPLDRLTNDNIVTEGQVDMLDIPGKGRCYVYIARFTYEPFQHSPNENPEAELPVQGGDYLLVWGQPDEDGFLDAETLDGRRGLVPANFVQKLVGDDLLEFHQAVLGLRDVDDSASTNIPQVSNVRLLRQTFCASSSRGIANEGFVARCFSVISRILTWSWRLWKRGIEIGKLNCPRTRSLIILQRKTSKSHQVGTYFVLFVGISRYEACFVTIAMRQMHNLIALSATLRSVKDMRSVFDGILVYIAIL